MNVLDTLEEATIADIHAAMRNGSLTARALTERYLARIEAFDRSGPRLASILTVNPRALEDADRCDAALNNDRSASLPILHGIPIVVKDNVDVAGLPTTAGSAVMKSHVPMRDAFLVQRLKAAGAIVLAKTNLHEFATWGETVSTLGGQTRNPYDLHRTPGGSSGGTGAAVASNFAVAGIGTDTINSVRSPASANSLVGLRPTSGLVSRTGLVPVGLTQDIAGPIARTVADCARLLDVIAGVDPDDAATAGSAGRQPESYTAFLATDGLAGARIGVLTSLFGYEDIHRDVNLAMQAAIDSMRAQGATLIELDEPFDTGALVEHMSVHLHELTRDLGTYLAGLGPEVSTRSVEEIIASGQFHPGIEAAFRRALALDTLGADYRDRLVQQGALRDRLLSLLDTHRLDAVVFPHQKRLVVPIGALQVERNGILASIAGFPALVVPAGFSTPNSDAPNGVPIGMEMVARPYGESVLFRLGHAFEQATHHRQPPPFARWQ